MASDKEVEPRVPGQSVQGWDGGLLLFVLKVIGAGCAAAEALGTWSGHRRPGAVRRAQLHTRHYRLTLLHNPLQLTQVLVGDQPISFEAYWKYADSNTDELPLYL